MCKGPVEEADPGHPVLCPGKGAEAAGSVVSSAWQWRWVAASKPGTGTPLLRPAHKTGDRWQVAGLLATTSIPMVACTGSILRANG